MRITQILENSTTSGSVATVAQPLMTQTRESVAVPGLKPVQQVMKGKAKKKGPYANSIAESKIKEINKDLKDLTSYDFEKKHKISKSEARSDMKKVNEDDLSEQDLIVIPGQGRLRGTGFTKHDPDRAEHEGETLKNSLHTIIRVATHLDKRLSTSSEFPEWVSEKIGATKSMMVGVMDYLISSQEMQHDSDAINEGEVSTSNLRTMYDLARMAKNYCNPEGQESLNELLKILKWYMSQGEQDVTEGSQRVDSIVTDALRVMKGPEVSDAVLALKRVLGDRAYNERRGFYNFYIDQIHDMYNQQGVAEDTDDKFSAADKVEELVDQYRLYDKRGWTDLFTNLAGRKLEVPEIRREMEYASKFLQLLDSIRMRSDYRGQQNPKLDQELIDLSNQWLSLFNKATSEFKGMSGEQGVAEGDAYFESLQQMVERQLEPTMDLDAWVDNFQNADPNKYHQFKNKTPEKKK